INCRFSLDSHLRTPSVMKVVPVREDLILGKNCGRRWQRDTMLTTVNITLNRALPVRRTHGGHGRLDARLLAKGEGWTVEDVVCSYGPQDRPYEEQHDHIAIAIVTSGTFQYRGSGSNGREMMTPGSLLLGSAGQSFECGHEHGVGDRCLSFRFTP